MGLSQKRMNDILHESLQKVLLKESVNDFVQDMLSKGRLGKLPHSNINVSRFISSNKKRLAIDLVTELDQYQILEIGDVESFVEENGLKASDIKVTEYAANYIENNIMRYLPDFKVDEDGLIRIYRGMELSTYSVGSSISKNDNAIQVGECWTTDKGCTNSFGGRQFCMIARIRPEDVDWGRTMYYYFIFGYDESEIKPYSDAMIEIDGYSIGENKVMLKRPIIVYPFT